jgi:hypothetical protein
MPVACGSHQNVGINNESWWNLHIVDDVSVGVDLAKVNQKMRVSPLL